MNTAPLKAYSPKARTAFINAISDRAAKLGITQDKNGLHVEPMERQGDIAILHGQTFPAKTLTLRNRLQQRMEQHGYQHTIEQMAYTWFNRFIAIRFMELHDYLEHGYRVLSHPTDKQQPEILEHAQHIDLAGLDKETVIQHKLDGTQDEKLYRLLLTAQCNALHQAMPFLFEKIDDETELLLPDNLLHSDSLIRQLVTAIPETDWANIEIIGWLYQFYISEKKDQVIGKVVKSEDIPAATQLFTPNWIVKYMVQNSLGRQWMMTYPDSSLKTSMDYYIEPAKQEASVETALAQQIPKELNPEHLTLIDPACGSGHILVEAYDLLTAIYLERGYRNRDIPKIILENNLYGLDIDERAAQMSAFALMMKARADDMRIFDHEIKLNVLAIQSTKDLDIEKLWQQLDLNKQSKLGTTSSLFEDAQTDLAEVIDNSQYHTLKNTLALFEQAETLGSLIQVPSSQAEPLKALVKQLKELAEQGDSFQKPAATSLIPYLHQASILAQQFGAVVANPPYMGGKYLIPSSKKYLKENFKGYEKDLFSAFIIRCSQISGKSGFVGLMTPNVWMYISTHELIRKYLIDTKFLSGLVELPLGGFKGATVQICTFTFQNIHSENDVGNYIRLVGKKGGDKEMAAYTLEAINNHNCGFFYNTEPDDFKKIPSSPIAYWVEKYFFDIIEKSNELAMYASPKKGMITLDDARFTRRWFENDFSSVKLNASNRQDALKSNATWFPITKGGGYRKWAGGDDSVVNWKQDGEEIKNHIVYKYNGGSYTKEVRSESFYFKPSISWGLVASGKPSFRSYPSGFIIGNAGPSMYLKNNEDFILPLLNSCVAEYVLKIMCPTINFAPGDLSRFPITQFNNDLIKGISDELVDIHSRDWNECQLSWFFSRSPLLQLNKGLTTEASWINFGSLCKNRVERAGLLESQNNHIFIKNYSLQNQLTSNVPLEQITLTVNPKYRYGGNLSDEELETRFCEDTVKELISYALGCMMGRYRLDKPGLIYAHSENIDFDTIYNAPLSDSETQDKYSENPFIADEDGIIPLTDREWFPDDSTNRLVEFVKVAWSEETLNENLHFIADNLSPKGSESTIDTIRRYFSSSFFKDHLKTYKKRPIYWLFSSGKHKAFEALVYLHRYNEGTLARMRMEYVVPLQSRISNQIDKLEGDIAAASSTASAKKAQKERDLLSKQHTELLAFDEQLRHYADQRIKLDLDDGVKVNYGKFGLLLAEVKAVTGKK